MEEPEALLMDLGIKKNIVCIEAEFLVCDWSDFTLIDKT